MNYNFRYFRPSGFDFGEVRPTPPETARLHVFVLMDGHVPRHLDFPDTDDGRGDVSSLLRSDDVLAIVRGEVVDYQVSTTTYLGNEFRAEVVTRKSRE